MDQEAALAVLVGGLSLAVPLASFLAASVGCGDNQQNANAKKKAASSRSKKQDGSVRNKLAPTKGGSKSSKSRRGTSSSKSASKSSKSKKQLPANRQRQGGSLSIKKKTPNGSKNKSNRTNLGGKKSSSSLSSRRSNSQDVKDKVKDAAGQVAKKADAAISSAKGALQGDQSARQVPSSNSSRSMSKSSKKLSQYLMDKNYVPVFATEASELRTEPKELRFNIKGGQMMVVLHNSSREKRFAVKLKCSDNQLYRVNPVYAFVDPGQSTTFTVYRHNGTGKIDKLVFLTSQVSKQEMNPLNAFKESGVAHPMMVVPLFAYPAMEDTRRVQCNCVKA